MVAKRKFINIIAFLLAVLFTCFLAAGVSAETVSVQALVDKQEVSVGESFMLQIKIDGDDSPAAPDLSGLQDFTVQPKGGGQNNRESITIINGKINRVSEHGYVYNYNLVPQRDGLLTIPAIEIVVAGKILLTQPIAIKVNKPALTDDFKLRISASRQEIYVGQPVILTVTWFVNRNVEEFQINLPWVGDSRFKLSDLEEDRNYQGQDAIPIHLPDGRVIARKGSKGLDGLKYITVTFRKVLIPQQAGDISLEQTSVISKVLTGYKQQRSRQPFDNFFNRRREVYKQFVTPANSLTIKVLELPGDNRPADFTGLVGQYSLATAANPTGVNVGDPIALNIMVTGPQYLDNVTLPFLNKQPDLINGFKVPEEMSPGVVQGRVKTFTQTIRAKNANLQEIPAISLSYFNPDTKQYEIARSEPIPIQVESTRIVTALDAEGTDPGVVKQDLESLDRGIAHNYVGDEVLVNQEYNIEAWIGSWLGLMLLILPPTAFMLILVPVSVRRKRRQDSGIMLAKKAWHEFSRQARNLKKRVGAGGNAGLAAGPLNESIRLYLGSRLLLPPGAIIYDEIKEHLHRKGLDQVLLAELKEILDWCEAHQYAGVAESESGPEELRRIIDNSLAVIQKIDQCLKT